jgi:RNA polymerase sigma-70 factor, ECF subfamily
LVAIASTYRDPLALVISMTRADKNVDSPAIAQGAEAGAIKAGAIDRALIADCCAGDRQAFNTFVRRHQQGVWHLVKRYVKSDSDANDVTQQTFVRAYCGLGGFRGDSLPRSWLFRIAINCALTWLRGRKHDESPADVESIEENSPEQGLLDAQRTLALRHAVAQLPVKQRQVVELRIYDELAFAEIAHICDCSENSAKVNFHHAIKSLRELTGALHGEGGGHELP